MKDEILGLVNKVKISQEINKRANAMIKNNHTEYFTTAELRMIAMLSATASIETNREARHKLVEWETELAECRQIFDNREQSIYEDKQTTIKDENEKGEKLCQ